MLDIMVVDDSAVVRKVIRAIVETTPHMRISATAADPLFAQQKLASAWPDVIILDLEMPRMDGITFLKWLMQERPTPVVVCSALTEHNAKLSFEAMACGAVTVINKPKMAMLDADSPAKNAIISAIRAAARANLRPLGRTQPSHPARPLENMASPVALDSHPLVAIGTSTGGTKALEDVFSAMPRHCPPIAVVQHMPAAFTAPFAKRLNQLSQVEVTEASEGQRLRPGSALIAPGGRHMTVQKRGAHFFARLTDSAPENFCRPSVDVLFRSVARQAGAEALGVIMTGMGRDGADGLLAMRKAGASTLAQDQATSVVFGMPKEAQDNGAAQRVMGLDAIAPAIMDYYRAMAKGARIKAS